MKNTTFISLTWSLGILGIAAALSSFGFGGIRADALAEFDPAEVEYLRQDAIANGVELGEGALLGALQFGRDCRVFFDALDRSEAGEDFLTNGVSALADRAIAEGRFEAASRYHQIVQQAALGDLSEAKSWATGLGGCGSVPRDVPET